MKFRKKPVVIEAMLFDGTKQTGYEILKWAGPNCGMEYVQTPVVGIMRINTLEGVMSAGIGDWIIKGVNGEFYPCKPDIFEKTYDPVHESSKCHFCGKPELGMSGDDLCECEEESIP